MATAAARPGTGARPRRLAGLPAAAVRRGRLGRPARAQPAASVIGNAWVYALSMAVYCTAWTYFGSVGRAAQRRRLVPAHLPGPDAGDGAGLAGAAQDDPHRAPATASPRSPTSSPAATARARCWPALVTLIARGRHRALHRAAAEGRRQRLRAADRPRPQRRRGLVADSTLSVALALAGFTIVFGTRHLDSSRAPRGHGRGHRVRVGGQAAGLPGGRRLRHLGPVRRARATCSRARRRCPSWPRCCAGRRAQPFAYDQWFALTLLAMLSVLVPAAAVPGDGGRERRRAPPQARRLGLSGLPAADQPVRAADRDRRPAALRPGRSVDAETFVLSLPLAAGPPALALVAFVGGLSAATGMVIVEAIAVVTMVCNDLVMPLPAAPAVLCAGPAAT